MAAITQLQWLGHVLRNEVLLQEIITEKRTKGSVPGKKLEQNGPTGFMVTSDGLNSIKFNLPVT